jgi:hypothetical protein
MIPVTLPLISASRTPHKIVFLTKALDQGRPPPNRFRRRGAISMGPKFPKSLARTAWLRHKANAHSRYMTGLATFGGWCETARHELSE